MKRLALGLVLLTACKQYESGDKVRERIKIVAGERRAAEAIAAEERRAVAAAKKETLSLRAKEIASFMKGLDSLTGPNEEKLSQFPKLVFTSQLALDQTTLKEVRARLDEEARKKKEAEEREKEEEAKGEEVSGKPLGIYDEGEHEENLSPKTIAFALVDHIYGSCVLYSAGERPFSAENIASPKVAVSAGGRVLVSTIRNQASESCQGFFAELLGNRYQEDYFGLYAGFIAFPQDIEESAE